MIQRGDAYSDMPYAIHHRRISQSAGWPAKLFLDMLGTCGFFSLDIQIAGGCVILMDMTPNMQFLDIALNIMIIFFHFV